MQGDKIWKRRLLKRVHVISSLQVWTVCVLSTNNGGSVRHGVWYVGSDI